MKLYENPGIIDKELDDEINLICDKAFEEVYTGIKDVDLESNKNNHESWAKNYYNSEFNLSLDDKLQYIVETDNSFNSEEIEFTLKKINDVFLYLPNQIVEDTITINMDYLESLYPLLSSVFVLAFSHPETGEILIDSITLEQLIGNLVFNTAFKFNEDTRILTFKLWEFDENKIDIFFKKGMKDGLVYFNNNNNFRLGFYNFSLGLTLSEQITICFNEQIIKGIKRYKMSERTRNELKVSALNSLKETVHEDYYWLVTFNNIDYIFIPTMKVSKDTLKRLFSASTIKEDGVMIRNTSKLGYECKITNSNFYCS